MHPCEPTALQLPGEPTPANVLVGPDKAGTISPVRYDGGLRVGRISEEARAVAAASLVQAHAAILGGVYAGRKEGAAVNVIPHELVEKMFTHYLGVVDRDPRNAHRNVVGEEGL